MASCPWCIVPRKKGSIRPAADWDKFKRPDSRVLALEKMGFDLFAQPYRDYDGGEPTAEQKAFARWVNVKSVHRSCAWENYAGSRPKK